MRILFVHQNFPGQFRYLACMFADAGHEVVGMGQQKNLSSRGSIHPKIKRVMYPDPRHVNQSTHRYLRQIEEQTLRGQAVYRACTALLRAGFNPDVVYSHPGWGEGLFLKEIFPQAKHIVYLEFYYSNEGADVGFDPEFPVNIDLRCQLPYKNFAQIASFESATIGISPTAWQRSRYPTSWQDRIVQLHEGVETAANKPDSDARFNADVTGFDGEIVRLNLGCIDEVVTYVARNLEPYRGFHTVMRAVPRLLELRPRARVLIVGGDGVSYGRSLPEGESYRSLYSREWKSDADTSRIFFCGQLPYEHYKNLLKISSLHIYLTYPFVLSWSCLEAMSTECLILASDTPPVTEVIKHGEQGFLVNFFDYDALAREAATLLSNRADLSGVRAAARQAICSNYERSDMLKRHVSLLVDC